MLKKALSSYFSPYESSLTQFEQSFDFLKNESPEIYNELQRTVLAGGKHLRPLMVFMAAELCNLSQKEALILAASAEMIHAASLCHDDVLDDAHIRRDLPTLNIRQGNKMAILSGDFLFSLALKNLCQLKNVRIVETASAMIASLSKGEWTQENCRKTRHYPQGVVEQIALDKTSSLFMWAFQAPFLASEQSEEKVKLAQVVGRELGLAFQILDDVIDFTSGTGKEPFIDLKKGILNSVSWNYFAQNQLLNSFEKGELNTEDFCQSERFATSLHQAREQARLHIERSNEAFKTLSLGSESQAQKVFNLISSELLKKSQP